MQNVYGFAIVAAIITITPGLDTFMVLRSSLRSGYRTGLVAGVGINTGLLVWGIASALGVAAVLIASREAFMVLRIAGALYLVWLGIRALIGAWKSDGSGYAVSAAPGMSGFEAYRAGLMSNLLNPKVGIFYLTIFPQFIPKEESALLWGIGLASIHILEGLVWLAFIAVAAAAIRSVLIHPRITRMLETTSGLVFIGFGARIARDIR